MGWFSRNKGTDSKTKSDPPPPVAPPRTQRMRDALTGEDVAVPEANAFRSSLRVQLFGHDYIAATRLATDRVAMRRLGDAWLCVTRDLAGGGEATVQLDELAKDGISPGAAFLLGRKLGVQDTARRVQDMQIGAALGANTSLLVANAFYLSAVALEARAELEARTPMIVCPITWHHWMVAELTPTATRGTLVALQQLVDSVADSARVSAAETIGTSLWWWPAGTLDPTPFKVDRLPSDLVPHLIA